MRIDLAREVYIFLSYVILGLLSGMVFDVARAVRGVIKMTTLAVGITDACFWIVVTGICTYCVFGINDGFLRTFVIMGFFLGCFIYFFTLSKLFFKIFLKIIAIIVNFVKLFFKILLTPFAFSYKIIMIYVKKINGSICHGFIRKTKKDKT